MNAFDKLWDRIQAAAVHSTHARRLFYDEPATGFLLLSSFAFDSSVASDHGNVL